MVLIQVENSLLQLRTPLTLVNGYVEEVDVGIQRKLVHRVDTSHVVENKEQDGGTLGTWTIPLQIYKHGKFKQWRDIYKGSSKCP